MTLVSIVTPSYNQASYLEYTIQSVLHQDYPNIEYIVIDGASSDGSPEIIRRHAEPVGSTARIAWWVSEPDSGQAEAINKGFQQAHGEIIAWLNSDDLYLPGAVSRAVAALEGNPRLGMLFGDALTIDPRGRPLNHLSFGDWGLNELMAFRIICQPAVFMRREVLEAAGWLDLSYHFMLDHHLWLRIAGQAPIQHLPGLLAAARYHPEAKNVRQAAQFSQEILRILAWMETKPELVPLLEANHRKILGGAHRLSARYLLEGGLYSQALREYSLALFYSPRYAFAHWRRMAYAFLGLIGATRMADPLLDRQIKNRKQAALPAGIPLLDTQFMDWPGLCLETE